MTVPFRQTIREGQSGSDVLAVKRAIVRMHTPDSGAMITRGSHRSYAGHSFVVCIRNIQRAHKIHQDGVYGRRTHEIVAPHFDAYGRLLYREAKIRRPKKPPVPDTSIAAAERLLGLHGDGKYVDDRGGSELAQIEATARGEAVWSPLGYYVHLDARILEVLCWLIEDKGYRIGTFAMCTDHGVDGSWGHSGGHAVDISSIDGISIKGAGAEAKVIAVLKDLRAAKPTRLRPWQLISGGTGGQLMSACYDLCIPNPQEYWGETLLEHTNHIHDGYE